MVSFGSMRKFFGLVVLLLGLAAVAFSAKTALTSTTAADRALAADVPGTGGAGTAPKRQLDNVRARTKELEREQQQKADEIAIKSAE